MTVFFTVQQIQSSEGVRWHGYGKRDDTNETYIEEIFTSRHDAIIQCVMWMIELRKSGQACEWAYTNE